MPAETKCQEMVHEGRLANLAHSSLLYTVGLLHFAFYCIVIRIQPSVFSIIHLIQLRVHNLSGSTRSKGSENTRVPYVYSSHSHTNIFQTCLITKSSLRPPMLRLAYLIYSIELDESDKEQMAFDLLAVHLAFSALSRVLLAFAKAKASQFLSLPYVSKRMTSAAFPAPHTLRSRCAGRNPAAMPESFL
mmetsp:Transcript_30631/g.76463  ORF Transcript_30631/g.76463 Transcript_30631/m.76463 type:complete len:189 (+) Transcript_30631:54-620(+)